MNNDNTKDYIPDIDHNISVAIWLYICCFAVLAMAVIGAVTRLTDSGLSMVEWRPIMGAIPPLNQEEWLRVFNLYREIPQYTEVNKGMSIDEFKNIFFWEWFHRVFGRLIGIIYFVPMVYFLITKQIPKTYLPAIFFFLFLGAMQGVMGWYMVTSGLADNTSVSHFRLAAHLGLAFVIFGLMLRSALRLTYVPTAHTAQLSPLKTHINLSIFCVSITVIWGAFVAGLDAGLLYNSFPLMGQYPFPSELFDMRPIWDNFIHGPAGVQFTHRVLAIVTLFVIVGLYMKSRYFNPSIKLKKLFLLMLALVITQVGLGILTLLSGVSIYLAAMHQATAFLLLASLIWISYEIPRKEFAQAVKEDDGYAP